MMISQVKNLTFKLRLLGMHNAVERRCEEAKSQELDYAEFMRLILEDEDLHRRERVTKRLTTQARFRSQASLEDFDMSFDRGLSKAKLKELALGSFHHNKENLILLGKTGEGKTHLAIALGRRLCEASLKTSFHSVNLFFEEVLANKTAGRYLNFIRGIGKAEIIILDDFGLRPYTHEEASTLMDILEERYRRGSVIVTSQVDPRGWHKLFEDPVIAEAIIDRLINPSQKITLKGGSYREKINTAEHKTVEAKTKNS